MKRAVLFIALACSAYAEDASHATTCHDWDIFDDFTKLVYIKGVFDGMLFSLVGMQGELPGKKSEDAAQTVYSWYFGGTSLTRGELAKGIDRICGEPENSPLDLVPVIRVFMTKVRGASQKDVEEDLRQLRALAAMEMKRKE